MPTWFGPVLNVRSPVDQDPVDRARNRAGNALMRYFGPQPVGVNVWLLTNGSVTTSPPADPSLVARVLYGAHYEVVTDAEAALLTAAGYGQYLS